MPKSEECERAVLGALMMNSATVFPIVASALKVDDFYFDRHQRIYAAAQEVDTAGGTVDLRTLQGALEHKGDLERVGGLSYLAGLDVDLPNITRVEEYAEIVRQASLRRRLVEACTKSYTEALRDGAIAADALSAAEDRIRDIRSDTVRGGFRSMRELVPEALAPDEAGEVIATGWGPLDEGLGPRGFVRGNQIVIAGRPGMGKSVVAANLARKMAGYGFSVAFYSLEMSEKDIVRREISAVSGVPLMTLKRSRDQLSFTDQGLVDSAARKLEKLPMAVQFRPGITAAQVEAEVRAMPKIPDVVFVDYLQLMGGSPGGSRTEQVGENSRRLKVMAGRLKCVVVLLSQLSRKPEERPSKRPQLGDLRDSGEIEQDADMVLFPFRPDYYEELQQKYERGSTRLQDRIIIAKQRDGELGDVEMDFQGECVRWVVPSDGDPFTQEQTELL